MSSFLYYHCSLSPFPDTDFDQLCKRLSDLWDQLEHPHKYLISKEDLDAGSGYAITRSKYPLLLQCAAMQWGDQIETIQGRTT